MTFLAKSDIPKCSRGGMGGGWGVSTGLGNIPKKTIFSAFLNGAIEQNTHQV